MLHEPMDFDEAKEHLRVAAEALTQARDDLEDARIVHEGGEREPAALDTVVAQTSARADLQAAQLQADEEALKKALAEEPDEEFVQTEKKRPTGWALMTDQVADLASAIDSANPDGVRLQAQSATEGG